jgi:hydrogenase maturation protease
MSGFPENLPWAGPAPILVLGLGNMLLSDDGLGPVLLLEWAEGESRCGEVEFLDGGTQGLSLLGHLSGRRALIIVDALQKGEAPGTVYVLTLPELRKVVPGRANSGHESHAGELLAAAELLDELPPQLFVVGVEPEKITTGLLRIGFAEFEDGVFQAIAFVLHAVHQTPGPDKLRGQKRQAKEDHRPAWRGSKDHHDAQHKECKSRNDLEESPDLIDRTERHEPSWAEAREQLLCWQTAECATASARN